MKMILHEQTIQGVVRPIHLCEPEIFADRESQGRSGHMGHGMCEFAPGKIFDFCSNTSKYRLSGHAAFGWVEFAISEDYGETWGEKQILPYSWKTLLDGINTITVEKCVACPDGSITAFCLRNSQDHPISCEPWDTPMVIRTEDAGKTWSEPYELCPYRGRFYDAFYKDGSIYGLHFCNDAEVSFCGNKPEHQYRLYRSDDYGKSFTEVGVVPFPDTFGRGYGNMVVTPTGDLMVYAYNDNDEYNMDVMLTHDMGKTWEYLGQSYVAKKIRNPQIAILNGQYILHGRAGENGESGMGGRFVLYTSADGFHWDEGHYLVEGRTACFYSNNLVLNLPDGRQRMLVQYSENYSDAPMKEWNGQVNTMHMFIE